MKILCLKLRVKVVVEVQQVWLWPYKAPDIVDFGSYDITIVYDPKDMNLEKYVLISSRSHTQANIQKGATHAPVNLLLELLPK